MARSAESGKSSEVEATVLQFGKKSNWEEVARVKRETKKRSASANGTFSKLKTKMVNEEHMDGTAIDIVLKLNAIEEDQDLHVTLHHMFDGLRKLGILDRAMIGDDYELFEEFKVKKAAQRAGAAPKDDDETAGKGDKKANGTGGANVKDFPPPRGLAAE